jgi:hypothetical protein
MPAPGQPSTPLTAQQAVQVNAAMRGALLASAPQMRKKLQAVTNGVAGQTSRVKLFNVGITTRLLLDVTFNYDVVTAAMVATTKNPFNIMSRIKVTDYDGTDRVNVSGYQLYVLNCVRRRQRYGYNNGSATAVLSLPSVPLTTGNGKQTRFMIEVPLAFDPQSDLRGALLTQTAVGEVWVSIDWNSVMVSATANDDAIFTSATGSLANTSFGVQVFQEYLLPQAINGQTPIPSMDLLTVYELNGALRSTDNIGVGVEKLFNYPNVRSVLGGYFNYINNSVMNPATTDITGVRQIANGNNVLKEYGAADLLFEQRVYMLDGSDIANGTYFILSRQKPFETALYGNVQIGITPATVSGTCNFEVMWESFYTKGQTLPGMSQASA